MQTSLPDFGDACATLLRQWGAAVRPDQSLPPYEELALGSLGRGADRTAFLASLERDQPRILRVGEEFEAWLGTPARNLALDELVPDCARILGEILALAIERREPVRRTATRVRSGSVEMNDILALPLATPLGAGALLCLGPLRSQVSLIDAVFRTASEGIIALAGIRDVSGRLTDLQVVALNKGAGKLLGRDKDDVIWKTASELAKTLPIASIVPRLIRVLESGVRDQFETASPTERGTLHLRLNAASLGDLVAVTLTDITGLKAREASFRLLFETNPIAMYVYDRETLRFLAVNDAALLQYGYDRDAFLALDLLAIRPPETREEVRQIVQAHAGHFESGHVFRHMRRDGSEMSVSVFARALGYENRAASLVAAIDITERERAERDLQRTQAFLDAVVESVPAMLFVKDAETGRFVLVNKAGEDMLGVRREDMIGRSVHDLFPPEQAQVFESRDRRVLASGTLAEVEEEPVQTQHNGVRILRTKKIALKEGDGPPRYLLGFSEDITERREQDRRIVHMAHHDALTDLPNRVLFRERLVDALAHLGRQSGRLALLCLDLDDFKGVNDTLGHPVGDVLLQQVAGRLRDLLRETDVAARLGGDEFAIIQTHLRTDDDARHLADRMIASLCRPYSVEGQEIVIGASIGIALGQADADPDMLLRNADMALYRAKAEGRRTYRFFEAAMNERLQARRTLERDLRRAFDERRFELHYQPLVDVRTGAVRSCEALLRWPHPERGMVSPAEFIPVAEEIGLIGAIGEWVLHEACREAKTWPLGIKVAVNLSPAQFRNKTLVHTVIGALAESRLPADRLEVEITESVLLEDSEDNLVTLHQLRALGVLVAMDDFGTGYSSLSYLRSFPFDKIKIDQSFVRELERSADCVAITRAIAGLGHSLGIATTAEGVETQEQLDRLRAQGCSEAQGYLFSPPRPASEIRPLLFQSFGTAKAA